MSKRYIYEGMNGACVCVCVYRSELPEGSSDEGLTLSCSELIERGQVDYRVKVTNTGKTGGGVSALAFVSSEVRVQIT